MTTENSQPFAELPKDRRVHWLRLESPTVFEYRWNVGGDAPTSYGAKFASYRGLVLSVSVGYGCASVETADGQRIVTAVRSGSSNLRASLRLMREVLRAAKVKIDEVMS